MHTSILYQNPSQTLTLLDLPQSIRLAQDLPGNPTSQTLLSTPALQEPYASTEPRSAAARANILARLAPTPEDEIYRDLIRGGLAEIRADDRYTGRERQWCLPRQLSPLLPAARCRLRPHERKRKRKLSDVEPEKESNATSITPVHSEPDFSIVQKIATPKTPTLTKLSLSRDPTSFPSLLPLTNHFIQNPHPVPTTLTIPSPTPINPTIFHIPPFSSFLLHPLTPSTTPPLHTAISTFLSPSTFDFILLDPPWPNRSADRSRTYQTHHPTTTLTPLHHLHSILHPTHIAPHGLVACWITHRPSTRSLTLATFAQWNVHLVEEWIWLKTTMTGEPVYAIDGLWRKPYEVLLLGQKMDDDNTHRSDDRGDDHHHHHPPNPQPEPQTKAEADRNGVSTTTSNNNEKESRPPIKRRLIVAVPDVHSRKPCLQELVEPLIRDRIGDGREYRALEVFARHLTAGWWALGDEVLKFNWEGHWGGMDFVDGGEGGKR